MRGAKPVPAELEKLHGNPSKKKRPIVRTAALTEPPKWLTREQRAAWRYAIENAPPGVLRQSDRAALAAFIVAEDLHRQAAEKQATTGLLVATPRNYMIQSPYVPIINRQALIMMKAAAELGFTPVARVRTVLRAPDDLPLAPRDDPHASKTEPSQSLNEFLETDPDYAGKAVH